MRVSVALFTADLRVHDNPVLQAALRNAERVVPLSVVDSGIRRTGFAGPHRVAFLADSLTDLDKVVGEYPECLAAACTARKSRRSKVRIASVS